MKSKHFNFVLFILMTLYGFSQEKKINPQEKTLDSKEKTFDNDQSKGDGLWSTSNNWQKNKKPSNSESAKIKHNVILDLNVILEELKGENATTNPNLGGEKITISDQKE
jgi:hypothetical protein